MKIEYQAHFGVDPISGEHQLVLRPEVVITLRGPGGSQEYHALVDTGADYTIVPSAAAELLGISLTPTKGVDAIAFGGQKLSTTFGDVDFELSDDDRESYRWTATVLFHEAEKELIVLGHVGFLHYFHAAFDGFAMELTLTPTEDFPHNS